MTMVNQCDVNNAAFKVVSHLPEGFHGLWYTAEDLAGLLRDGGISGIDRSTVTKALRNDKVIFKRNKWRNTTYFMLGTPKAKGWSPKQQMLQDTRVIGFLPHMPTLYFKKQADLKDAV